MIVVCSRSVHIAHLDHLYYPELLITHHKKKIKNPTKCTIIFIFPKSDFNFSLVPHPDLDQVLSCRPSPSLSVGLSALQVLQI